MPDLTTWAHHSPVCMQTILRELYYDPWYGSSRSAGMDSSAAAGSAGGAGDAASGAGTTGTTGSSSAAGGGPASSSARVSSVLPFRPGARLLTGNGAHTRRCRPRQDRHMQQRRQQPVRRDRVNVQPQFDQLWLYVDRTASGGWTNGTVLAVRLICLPAGCPCRPPRHLPPQPTRPQPAHPAKHQCQAQLLCMAWRAPLRYRPLRYRRPWTCGCCWTTRCWRCLAWAAAAA